MPDLSPDPDFRLALERVAEMAAGACDHFGDDPDVLRKALRAIEGYATTVVDLARDDNSREVRA